MGWVVGWARVVWAKGLLRWSRLFCYVLPGFSLPCLVFSFLRSLSCSGFTLTVFSCHSCSFFIFLAFSFRCSLSVSFFFLFLLFSSSSPPLLFFLIFRLFFFACSFYTSRLVVSSKSKSRRSRRAGWRLIEVDVELWSTSNPCPSRRFVSSKSKSRLKSKSRRSRRASSSLVEVELASKLRSRRRLKPFHSFTF